MKDSKFAIVGLAGLAVGLVLIGLMLWPTDRSDFRGSISGDGLVVRDSDLLRAPEEKKVPVALTVPEDGTGGGDWLDRYPEATVREERSLLRSPDELRIQYLLETGNSDFPYVIWEDKVGRDSRGEAAYFGFTAYMGNVFLAETDPEVVDRKALQRFVQEFDLYVERELPLSGYTSFGVPEPSLGKLEFLVAEYQARFPDAIVELEIVNFTAAAPREFDSSRKWGLEQIGALDAWEFATGTESVVVAVLDTGLNVGHSDISSNVFLNTEEIANNGLDDDGNGLRDDRSGWDFFDGDSSPDDIDGHGTHVAGILGAVGDNQVGTVGVNWDISIMPLRVGTDDGLRTGAIVEALAYVARMKQSGVNIAVTNNSYGSGSPSSAVQQEIRRHRDLGIVFVAAAGNDGFDMDDSSIALQFPAGYTIENILSVANSNQGDLLSLASNRGEISVDLSAPGTEIYSTYLGNGYAFLSGTSMASPMVAGAVALIAGEEPELSGAEIRQRILDTVDLIPNQAGTSVTGGRLNLLAALRPELKGHFVGVSNVDDAIVLAGGSRSPIFFDVATLPGAEVAAELLDGSTVATLVEVDGGSFALLPSGEGMARVRFSAVLSGLEKTVDRWVVLGSANDVLSGLQHRYEFEGSGSSEPDLAGNGDGTLQSAQKLDTNYGRAAQFAGGASKMLFNANYSSRVTIAALVRSDNFGSSPHPRIVNTPAYYLYFSSSSGAGTPDGNRNTLKFYADRSQSFGVWNAPPESVRQGEWYYVVGSYDSSNLDNAPSLFLNGKRLAARLQQLPAGSATTTSGPAFVGNNEASDRSWQGPIASVRLYNRELGEAEVAALGASMTAARWEGATLEGPEDFSPGDVMNLSIQDLSIAGVSTRWRVSSLGRHEVSSSSASSLEVRLLDETAYVVSAYVSDGIATRVFTRSLGSRLERFHTGQTSGGGQIWLELEPSSDVGYVTILDPDTGFYRFREEARIDASGAFSTLEDSVGRVAGLLVDGLVGEVPGYGISFNGETLILPFSSSSFAGRYRGGVLGRAGDSVVLEVLPDGRALLSREGFAADLALGRIEEDGSFSLASSRGEAFSGSIDLEAASVVGTVGEAAFFLKAEDVNSEGRLRAGSVVSALGDEGSFFGSFVGEGETAQAELATGALGRAPLSLSSLEFVALSDKGHLKRLDAGDSSDLLEVVGRALATGDLETSSRLSRALRFQFPVGGDAGSAVVFSVEGGEPLEVLVSARSLLGADPELAVFRFDGEAFEELAANASWLEGTLFSLAGESSQGPFRALLSAALDVGLAELEAVEDAAMRIWLEPGTYVARLKAESATSGNALLGVFELR